MSGIPGNDHKRALTGEQRRRKTLELQRLMKDKSPTPEFFEFSIDDRHFRVRNPFAPPLVKGRNPRGWKGGT